MARLDWSRANLLNPDPARVIEVGEGWARDAIVKGKRQKKGVKAKPPKAIGASSLQVAQLVIPIRCAVLIASIMRDLGRALPSKRNRLNNRIKSLIDQGIISQQGEIVKDHPVILEWYALVKSRQRRGT